MMKWPLSTIRCLVANEIGQFLSAIFRNGDADFGGYLVRLMLICSKRRIDPSIAQALTLKQTEFGSAIDPILIQPSGGMLHEPYLI